MHGINKYYPIICVVNYCRQIKMSMRQVLSNIVHGNGDFCCLCYTIEATENAVWIHDEVLIDSLETQTMSELIKSIFGEDILNMAVTFGMFCYKCKVLIVNSYKFMKQSKENLQNINSVINNMTESFDNMLPEIEKYKTLYVSVEQDYSSKQFYDDVNLESTVEAYRRFTRIIHPLTQKKIKEKYPSCLKTVTKEAQDAFKKMVKKPLMYDIPAVPTAQITMDNSSIEYECVVCQSKYIEEKQLRHHFFKKHYPKNVKCTKCPRSFITFEMLKMHQDDCHCDGVCSECGKFFKSKYTLKKHELNHGLRITCSDCSRVYRSMEAFKKHITDDVCRQKSRKSADQATFECDYCNKRYCYKPYLAKHIMYEHGNAVGFRCEYCNKQFYTQSRLKIHTYKHTHEKNFECMYCDGRFVTRESLIYHTRLHTGEKPYKCEHCDKAFLNASRRLDHVRRHHTAPSLECDLCHAKFKVTGSLSKHRKRHLNPNSRLNISRNLMVTKSDY